MTETDQITELAIEYLTAARARFDAGDYAGALSALELARDEIEYLADLTEDDDDN